jgi:hypothetical protein
MVISGDSIVTKRFGRTCKLATGDIVLVPAITRVRGNSGFCIFDIENGTVEAVKV